MRQHDLAPRVAGALLLALLLALAAPLAAPAAAAPAGQLPPLENRGQEASDPEEAFTAPLDQLMPLDPDIVVGTLENGLHYYIRENGYPAERAELRLVVKAGSVLEDEDQLGLAHFVEHMAFNGTESFPKQELVKALESFGMRFGADINAYTSFDETVYQLSIPTDSDEIVTTAFQILEDWAHGLSFEDEEIAKERGVVIEEWRLGLGAQSRIRDQQFPILFQDSRYAERLPIGTLESLQTFAPDAARRFYRDWYRPDLMAVIAVGDFDKTDVEERIRSHFGDLTMPEEPRPRPVYDVPEHQETLFGIATDPEVPGTSVSVYHKLPLRDQGYVGTYRQSLVENLYHSMFNRRLRELATQTDPPFLRGTSNQGIFVPTREVYVLGAAVPEGQVEDGLTALFREAVRVERDGFTETELEREKSQVLRLFERIYTERALQESELFTEEFQRAFLEGESVPGIEYEWALYQRFVPEVTVEEVNQVGRQFLTDDNRVVLVTAPENTASTLPSEDRILAVLNRVDDLPITPYVDTTTTEPLLPEPPDPGTIVEERQIEEVGVTEWTLSNGATVVLKPTDFREDEVLFRAVSPGGTSLASDDDYVAAITATQVVSASGFGGFSARQITNQTADKVLDVEPFIDVHEEGFRGGTSPRDLQTFFQLLHLKFTRPQASPEVFRLMTDQIRENLTNRNVSPEEAWRDEVRRTLVQDHPRRRTFEPDVVEEMDLQTSFDFYRDRFADASDFTFVFVGNIEVDQMRPLVERYVASLPSIDREESWRDEGIDYPDEVVTRTVRRGQEPKALTALVFTGRLPEDEEEDGLPDNPDAVSAMGEVLQTRLRELLREDLGSTYSVGVDPSIDRIPDREYSVAITFGADPGRIEELTRLVFGQVERLQSTPPDPQEVANVQAAMRRQLELALRENGYWLGRLVSAYREGDDPADIPDRQESIDALTPEDVHAAAQRLFDQDSYVQVTLLPESGS